MLVSGKWWVPRHAMDRSEGVSFMVVHGFCSYNGGARGSKVRKGG
jgi:hypothetical protein